MLIAKPARVATLLLLLRMYPYCQCTYRPIDRGLTAFRFHPTPGAVMFLPPRMSEASGRIPVPERGLSSGLKVLNFESPTTSTRTINTNLFHPVHFLDSRLLILLQE